MCETRRGSRTRSPKSVTVPNRRCEINEIYRTKQSLIAQAEKYKVCETRRGSRTRSPKSVTVPNRRCEINEIYRTKQSLIAQAEKI